MDYPARARNSRRGATSFRMAAKTSWRTAATSRATAAVSWSTAKNSQTVAKISPASAATSRAISATSRTAAETSRAAARRREPVDALFQTAVSLGTCMCGVSGCGNAAFWQPPERRPFFQRSEANSRYRKAPADCCSPKAGARFAGGVPREASWSARSPLPLLRNFPVNPQPTTNHLFRGIRDARRWNCSTRRRRACKSKRHQT
jgi:hypothetical protein